MKIMKNKMIMKITDDCQAIENSMENMDTEVGV